MVFDLSFISSAHFCFGDFEKVRVEVVEKIEHFLRIYFRIDYGMHGDAVVGPGSFSFPVASCAAAAPGISGEQVLPHNDGFGPAVADAVVVEHGSVASAYAVCEALYGKLTEPPPFQFISFSTHDSARHHYKDHDDERHHPEVFE